jgi:hypothetical protein
MAAEMKKIPDVDAVLRDRNQRLTHQYLEDLEESIKAERKGKKRPKSRIPIRRATERELAILRFGSEPSLARMEAYSAWLDKTGQPVPAALRSQPWDFPHPKGFPATQLEAWQSKEPKARQFLKNERSRVWERARNGVYTNLPEPA